MRDKIEKRKIFLGVGILIFIALFASFLYDPYSPEEIAKNLEEANKCNREAISYLGDYYEKTNEEAKLKALLLFASTCKKN